MVARTICRADDVDCVLKNVADDFKITVNMGDDLTERGIVFC